MNIAAKITAAIVVLFVILASLFFVGSKNGLITEKKEFKSYVVMDPTEEAIQDILEKI